MTCLLCGKDCSANHDITQIRVTRHKDGSGYLGMAFGHAEIIQTVFCVHTDCLQSVSRLIDALIAAEKTDEHIKGGF